MLLEQLLRTERLADRSALSIPLAGVPQIPDDVERTIRMMGEWALTDEQIDRAKKAIWEHATLEIQRRHQASKLGVRLEEHFQYTPDQARAKELGRIRADEFNERRRQAKRAAREDDSDLELCAGRGLEI